MYLSSSNFISHSELWAISSARLLGELEPSALVTYTRPVFYSFLKIPYFFDLTTEQHIVFARMLFGLLAFFNYVLLYRLVRDLGFDRWTSQLFLIFLLSFHVFFYNFYRVRSDFVALFFFLLSLHRIMVPSKVKIKNLSFDPLLPVTIFLLSLSTPKSIYFIVWLCVIYFLAEKESRPISLVVRNILVFLVLPAVCLLVSAQIFGLGLPGLGYVHAQLLSYYLNSFASSFQANSWIPPLYFLKINFPHCIAIALGCFLFLSKKSCSREDRILFSLFLLSLLTFMIHPERWEYFIAHLLPFFALPFLFVINHLKSRPKWIALLFCLLVWFPLHITFYRGWWVSNRGQLNFANEISFIMEHFPGWRIFDATGVDPRSNNCLWFLGPSDFIGNANTVAEVTREKPEIILFTPKFEFGGPDLIVTLYKFYEEVRPGLWVNKNQIQEFNDIHFPDWNHHLGMLFIYDYRPKLRY